MTWNPPDPGELREIVQVETCPVHDDKPDAYNAQEPGWKPVGTVRAKVEQLSGREFWFAQQANSALSIRVTIRYLAGLNSLRYRLVWRNMVLSIGAVINPDGIKVWHQLMCQSKMQPAELRK